MRQMTRRCGALAALLLLGVAAVAGADTVRADVDLTTHDIGSKETLLGDTVADAIRGAAHADIAFVPASSFADITLPKGAVNSADIVRALDSAYRTDTIVLVKLTGSQVVRALEQSVYLYPNTFNGFLSVSGLSATVNASADGDHRVSSVRVGGEPIDASHIYHVAMPEPLANGAYMYFRVWKKTDIQKDTERTLESALTAWLTEHRTLAKTEDRLALKK